MKNTAKYVLSFSRNFSFLMGLFLCTYRINITVNVTTNFGPEVEMLPFLRMRTEIWPITWQMTTDHRNIPLRKSGSVNSMAATLYQLQCFFRPYDRSRRVLCVGAAMSENEKLKDTVKAALWGWE